MSHRREIRGLVIAALAGAVAPFVVTTVMGLFALHVWSPTVRYLWYSHSVSVAKLAFDAATLFDVVLGALLGAVAGFGIGHLSRAPYLSQWLTFVAFFVLSAGVPVLIDHEYDLLVFFFTRPLIVTFLAVSALGFWAAGKQRGIAHVA
jgi:hypothetical protein